MVSTRPCTSTCVIDGMLVTVTFYPDNGVLRIADSNGKCIKETRWHASWRALLDEFRGFAEQSTQLETQSGTQPRQNFATMIGRLGEHESLPSSSQQMALA
ncbi:hypothetical protein [Paraburkholderia sp. BCC1886]|uniref:hypothetical protein n=1 Tax=Paraburkholderia sp. BCC1886 TaxID=2562670 RepID=UPI0011827CF1|nr:hypothetical protein [Paraburkholderia sp. BCC1886]